MLKDRFHGRFHLDLLLIGIDRCPHKIFLFERKQLDLFRVHVKRVFHLGVYDIHLIQFALVVQLHDTVCDHTRPVQGWILYRILKFGIYFHFDHVMIVCARKPLIRSDHDVTSSFLSVRDLRLLIKVTALRIRNMSEETGNRHLQRIKVRLGILKLLLRNAELGRRDHIHGIRDLHGILNTFHLLLDFLGICHPILSFH